MYEKKTFEIKVMFSRVFCRVLWSMQTKYEFLPISQEKRVKNVIFCDYCHFQFSFISHVRGNVFTIILNFFLLKKVTSENGNASKRILKWPPFVQQDYANLKFSIKYQGPIIFNSLSTDIKESVTYSSFTKKLKSHVISKY